jgi:hypothetical protein
MAQIELAQFVTRSRVEWAYREAKQAQMERRGESLSRQAWRAAQARDARLLLALDKGAQILQRMSEEQFGQRGMDVAGYHVPATEYQMWKNAYTTLDGGDPEQPYIWIYVAAGLLAGVIQ